MKIITSEAGRRWVYGIGTSGAGVAVAYGWITSDQAVVWLGLLSALLGGIAWSHVGERGLDEPRRAAGDMRNLIDVDAPDGYETSDVAAAKTEIGDLLGMDFGGYDNDDLDTIHAADRVVERLLNLGWRPTHSLDH